MASVKLVSHVPRTAPDTGVIEAVRELLGASLHEVKEHAGEITLTVVRDEIFQVLKGLRDAPGLEYQQLMEIAGVDYPERTQRFEVNYQLLSLTLNRRIRVKVMTDEQAPVPSVVGLWPVASWLEREVFDMYGVAFVGNPDLRRILTDYGFEGFPFRKDFPLTGYVEMRYSEAEKRVIYEPVDLPQDFRTFDFLMPWQGPEYRLPGDEKAEASQPGAPTPASAPAGPPKVPSETNAETPKTTDSPADTGAGKPADEAARREARKSSDEKADDQVSKDSDIANPTPDDTGRRRPGGGAA